MEKQRITFIVNPISGTQSKKSILEMIDKYVDRNKYDFEVTPTQFAGHAIELASIAAAEGAFMVVAIGGDGTINEIGRSLVHTKTALGIIPCGSGNGLARHLQIPMDPKRAIDIINMGVTSCVDYGKINDIPFFCTCGVGFDALVSFAYNLGAGNFRKSTLLRKVRANPDNPSIRDEFGRWIYGGGRVLPGLVARREAEADLYFSDL